MSIGLGRLGVKGNLPGFAEPRLGSPNGYSDTVSPFKK